MKNIAFILIFIPLISISQVSLGPSSYKSYRVDIYLDGKVIERNSDMVFTMNSDGVVSDMGTQFSTLRFREEPKYRDIGTHQDNLSARSLDSGGNKCNFFIIYDEDSGSYVIAIDYSNVLFLFEAKKIDTRVEKNQFMELLELNNRYVQDPQYTDEEIDQFLSQFGEPTVLRQALIRSLLMGM